MLLAGVRDILDKTRHKGLFKGMRTLTRSYWGMQLGHLGMVLMAVGVVLSSQYSDERPLHDMNPFRHQMFAWPFYRALHDAEHSML